MQSIPDCGAFLPTSPSAIVPRGAPAAPVTLVAAVLGAQGVRVNWTAPASIGAIVSYRIGAGLAFLHTYPSIHSCRHSLLFITSLDYNHPNDRTPRNRSSNRTK